MKLLLGSIWIALVSSTVSAAAPQADLSEPAIGEQPATLAAPAADLDLARRFVSLSLPPDRYMELMRAGIRSGASAHIESLEDASERADAEKVLDKVVARLEPKVREQLPNLFEAYAQAYAREYSAEELKQLIVFAGSPVGRHFLSRQELVEEDEAVQDAQMMLFEATAPVMEQMRKEMCADKAAERMASGDTKAKCPLSDGTEVRSS